MKMGCCFSCHDDDDQGGSERGDQEALIDPAANVSPVVTVPRSDSVTVGTAAAQSIKGQEDELAKILQETASAMIDVSTAGSHSLDQREFQDRSKNYLHRIQNLNPSLLLMPQSNQPSAEPIVVQASHSPVGSSQNSAPISSSPSNHGPVGSPTGVPSVATISTSQAPCLANSLINPTVTSGGGGIGSSNMILGDVPNPEKHLGTELISDEDKELMAFALEEMEEALHSIRVSYDGELVVPFGSDYSAAASSPSSDRMVTVSD